MHEIQKKQKRELTSRSFQGPTSWHRVPRLGMSKEEYKQVRHACPQLASRASLNLRKRANHLKGTVCPLLAKRYIPRRYNKRPQPSERSHQPSPTRGACNPYKHKPTHIPKQIFHTYNFFTSLKHQYTYCSLAQTIEKLVTHIISHESTFQFQKNNSYFF